MSFLLILLNVFFVSFTDKPEKSAPALSPRAVEQRAKWHIPTDALDYPVCRMYQDSLRRMGVRIHHTSRWFNGATCEMDSITATRVAALSFVKSVQTTRKNNTSGMYMPHRAKWHTEQNNIQTVTAQAANYTDAQLALYNLTPLHNAGFEGQGILMTVCDGSFYNANTLSCFRDSLELGHFDFTDDEDVFYGQTGTHGTECLSVISGIQNGFYGSATQAHYYLMRSEEDETESPKEMDNLVAALEKADSLGVNVFSASLGYAMFDNNEWTLNKNTDLDGKTTRVSLAATIAARKGMLVCIAAGNEGNALWRTISAPADADSILTVGAVGTDSIVGSFSSYGPSSDGRIKPEVCAVGVQTVLIYPDGRLVQSKGTSFATPLLAGLAASLWSALPDENAMQIRERIIRSAHLYAHPDSTNHIGYGIPNAWLAYTMPDPTQDTPSSVTETPAPVIRKILHNGQILIIRNGNAYTVSGLKVQ